MDFFMESVKTLVCLWTVGESGMFGEFPDPCKWLLLPT